MILQEIQRLQVLAGIILEAVTDADRESAFARSGERVSFNRELLKQAIEHGETIGLLFRAKNEKYETPIYKYRTINPVAFGISTAGREVVRGLHVIGQSEFEARKSGKRSAEAENQWRLFKTENIRGMWLTGKFFDKAPAGYNSSDKGMSSVITRFDAAKAKAYQNSIKPAENPENTDV